MFKNYKQIFVIVIAIVLLSSGAMLMAPSGDSGHKQSHTAVNFPFAQLAEFFIINNLSAPTPANFSEHIVVNSSQFSGFENSNLSNILFTVFGGAVVPSWLQSGNSNTDNNTSYWLRINTSIPAHSLMALFMDAAPLGDNILNNYSIGEAPQLSGVYGQYDDGSHIFNFYDNFAGTKLNASKWTSNPGSNYAVDNGIKFTKADSYITSNMQFAPSGYVEAYGLMNSPATNNSNSYDLGGVGFGSNGLDYTSPVVTSGWAEGYTNGPGLTFYDGTGPYQYNYSKSINMSRYHTFGVGFINYSYTTGIVDNVIQNSSSRSYLISSGGLNITLGFQANDYPTVNNFRYIFEFNSTSKGTNLPFSFQSYKVSFRESGLPADSLWGITMLDSLGLPGNGGLTLSEYYNFSLPDGKYNFTVQSGEANYMAVSKSGNFTINGNSILINVSFEPVTFTAVFQATGLPRGTNWSVEVYGASLNKTTFYSITPYINVSLMNGSYTAMENVTQNGYIPLPNYETFSIFGYTHYDQVTYESPANASYIRPISSFNPYLKEQYNGYNFMAAGYNMTSSISIVPNSNILFVTMFDVGVVISYNITTGTYLKSIMLGSSSHPISSYYDPADGYLYVANSGTGNLTVINPKTMTIVSNVTLFALLGSGFSVVQSPQSDLLYAFGYNNTNNSRATAYVLQPSGKIIKEVNFTQLNPQFYGGPIPLALSPPVYGQNILVANGSGIMVLNTSNGGESYYPAPTSYLPAMLAPYGGLSADYLVSNENGSSNLMFDAKDFSYLPGPDIPGMINSWLTDPANGYLYLGTTSDIPAYTGNITVVSPSNGTILSSVFATAAPMYLDFSMQNQTLFSLDFISPGNVIHTYSVTKAFTISFTESGLPSGTDWYVNITGQVPSGPIQAGATYSLSLVNQTYSYSIGTSDLTYKASAGTFTADSSKTIAVKFTLEEYQVTFVETGLPSGTTWSFTVNGIQHNVSGTQFTLSLTNGTYNYTITSMNGYTISNQTGNITVDGSSVSVNVRFSPVSSVSYTLYIEIGIAAAVIAIGAGLFMWRRSQHKP